MRVKLLIFLTFISWEISAQNVFDEHVSVDFKGASFIDVLDELSELTEFDYAFNPYDIPKDFTFTAVFKDTAVFVVLKQLCYQAKVDYQQKGDNWLIVPKKVPKNKPAVSIVKGKVKTKGGESIKITEKTLKLESYSDTAGNYVLLIPSPEFKLNLEFDVVGYEGKKFPLKVESHNEFNVKLKSSIDTNDKVVVSEVLYSGVDTVRLPSLRDDFGAKLFVSDRLENQAEASLSINNKFGSISLIPGISLSGRKSGQENYKVSFNLFGAYSAGHIGLEVGFMNINRFNVKGVQFAMLGNVNGGQTKAWQFATVYNVAKLGCNGLQLSMLYNRTERMMRGVQLSSFINSSTGYANGVQVAALANASEGNVKGVQVSLVNWSDSINGAQVAIINRSKKLKGVQLGIVNVIDSVSKGLSIAPVNLIKGGYVSVETTINEQEAWSLSFNSGVKRFYGVVSSGVVFKRDAFKLGLGAGTFLVDRKVTVRLEGKWELEFKSGASDEYLIGLPVTIPLFKQAYLLMSPSIRMYKPDEYKAEDGIVLSSSNTFQSYLGGSIGIGFKL